MCVNGHVIDWAETHVELINRAPTVYPIVPHITYVDPAASLLRGIFAPGNAPQ
jgi:hypothetical protein